MNKRLKVLTVVGTRPEIIRLSRVISALDRHTNHVLVHTGQNYDYELNEIFFKDLELRRPNHYLKAAGKTSAETIGAVIARTDALLAKERPDAFLVLGDTNSCLAAVAAKRRHIPVFHMEAGNRCFDFRVPEEINRRIVDHVSDINLTYSSIAREYLLREGLPPDRIIKTGSPMFEVLSYYADKIAASAIVEMLGLAAGSYFVVSCHREENVDGRVAQLAEVLRAIVRRFGLKIIMSTHPRTRKRLQAAGIRLPKEVALLKPLAFSDYVRLQQNARVVVSDSGTITEESSILGFPAVNIRDSHERPEGMEEAAVMMTGLAPERVIQALTLLDEEKTHGLPRPRLVADYDVPDVSAKVVRILLSHVNYVHQNVWRKT